MYGCHQTFDNTVFVVDDLGNRGEAVGCAGSVGDLMNLKVGIEVCLGEDRYIPLCD